MCRENGWDQEPRLGEVEPGPETGEGKAETREGKAETGEGKVETGEEKAETGGVLRLFA